MKEIKICGLSRPVDIEAVNRYMPDYCGFIINFPKSKRNVTPDTVRFLIKKLDPKIKKVGVFVDQPVELVADLLNKGIIDIAQLHGSENNDYIEDLQDLTDCPIWKAFQIKSQEDIDAAEESLADLVLLDAGQGSGKSFNWDLIGDFPGPYALAGGLNFENIRDAMKTDAVLLDISGGVETDGFKDPEKIESIINIIRNN